MESNHKINIHAKHVPGVLTMWLQPYEPGSKFATNFPYLDSFTGRNHFVLHRSMSHIAVGLEFANRMYTSERSRRCSQTFFINVYDPTDGMVVSSRSLYVCLEADERYKKLRVDVPLRARDIDPDKPYSVAVVHPADPDTPLLTSEIRFVACWNTPPTLWYTPCEAYLLRPYRDGHPCDARYHEADGSVMDDHEYRVEFILADRITDYLGFTPEIYTMVERWDRRELDKARLEWVDAFDHDKGLKISVSFYGDRRVCDTTLRVHLQCMGHTFATAAFMMYGEAREGVLTDKDLAPVSDVMSAEGWEELCRRRAEVKEWEERDRRREEMKKAAPAPPSEAMKRLSALVGLDDVKAHVASLARMTRFFALRESRGLKTKPVPLHSMYLGPAGTGKTTVATLMGEVLRECGVLSKGHVVVRDRATLMGQYYNSEGEKTLEALEEARGGILFIDEAYQLFNEADPRDPCRFVLEALMNALADEKRRDWMLILAGYTEPTLRLLELNPGLASRIPECNRLHFEPFTTDQLIQIALDYLAEQQYRLTPRAEAALKMRIEADRARADSKFGNGRHVINLIELEILPAMAARIERRGLDDVESLTLIKASDVA